MKKFVITIGREFGCNAQEVGRQLAAELGVNFYDKELVELAARRSGLNEDYYSKSDENKLIIDSLFTDFGYGATPSFYSPKSVEAQAFVIRELANKESCIMLGRCSDYVLREFDNVLNVFVYSSLEYRINHISETYNESKKKASKMISKIDSKRHAYYKHVTGKNRGNREVRNLMIDVETFGVEGTVQLIRDAVKIRFKI